MDREILFRGKRIDNGKWVEGDLLQDQDLETVEICGWEYYGGGYEVLERGAFAHRVSPSTVGQYTGLTDKNGVKIFEGDIVLAGYYKWKCKVVWDEKCARFICFTLEKERRIVYVDMVDENDISAIEVIGNIYNGKDEHSSL